MNAEQLEKLTELHSAIRLADRTTKYGSEASRVARSNYMKYIEEQNLSRADIYESRTKRKACCADYKPIQVRHESSWVVADGSRHSRSAAIWCASCGAMDGVKPTLFDGKVLVPAERDTEALISSIQSLESADDEIVHISDVVELIRDWADSQQAMLAASQEQGK